MKINQSNQIKTEQNRLIQACMQLQNINVCMFAIDHDKLKKVMIVE